MPRGWELRKQLRIASLIIKCEQRVLEMACRVLPCSTGAGTLLRGDFSYLSFSYLSLWDFVAHLINVWRVYTGRKDMHLLTRKDTQEAVGRDCP